ncbi:unannotated protein [freshwater metagenome]|uniref:Unannotated protein n=1 Tax=freshwater metagenome TaxID=449393 RepID=A0A6J7EBD2_9ZZZZ|nr:MFS transporter [Actinomycetota bacterium]
MILRLYRNFRLIWIGQVVSVIGDGMQSVALLWWARRTGGNALLAAVAASMIVPFVICAPFGGWLADRYDRRHLLIAADLQRVVVTATLAVLAIRHHASPVLICALVALSSMATAVFDPTYSTVVPSLIESEHRAAANGLNMANSAVGGLIGPLLGGLMISVFDVGNVMLVNAATFAWSAAFIVCARIPRPAGATPQARERHSTRGAIASVVREPQLRRLVGLASVLNMVAAPVPLLIVALAVDRFHVGPGAYGALEITVSAGVLVGALLAGKFAKGAISLPMLLIGGCLASAGLLPIVGTGVAFLIGGVAIAIANTSLLTTLQGVVAPEVQGRVFGVVGALGEGLRPVGLALGAPLLAIVGVSWAFIVVGGLVIVTTLLLGPRR